MVNVGRYVGEALERTLNEEHRERWRCRPDKIRKNLVSEERARRPNQISRSVEEVGIRGTGLRLGIAER